MVSSLHFELFPEVKIAVSGEHLGRALPSTLNISINYFRPVSVKIRELSENNFVHLFKEQKIKERDSDPYSSPGSEVFI